MIKELQRALRIDRDALEAYLRSLAGGQARLLDVTPLGQGPAGSKGYGYGVPLLVEYETGGARRRAVLETVKKDHFGHEEMADRAQGLLWAHGAFNALPRHVRSLDVGAIRREGDLVSLGDAEEFFILTEFADGGGYFRDLVALRDGRRLTVQDLARCDALCDYLAGVHTTRGPDPGLYVRRLRELLGHGECILGLTDSYPDRHGFITAELLEEIEHLCLSWRWKLKGRTHRLRQVHGDFHPWNLLFREAAEFTALDRSRGEWGEPADDVACLTLNYLFFSLQRSGRLDGAFGTLWGRFWRRYLELTNDAELLEVVAPFFAFRGLVMASPLWYPDLSEGVRLALFTFVRRTLAAPVFDYEDANAYCGL